MELDKFELIRRNIDKNDEKMRNLFNAGQFTLNKEVLELINENEKIRATCEHEFVDGVCKWCDELEVNV